MLPEGPEITDAEFDAGRLFTPLQKRALRFLAVRRDPVSLDRLANALHAAPAELKGELADLGRAGLIETKVIEGHEFYRTKPGRA